MKDENESEESEESSSEIEGMGDESSEEDEEKKETAKWTIYLKIFNDNFMKFIVNWLLIYIHYYLTAVYINYIKIIIIL